MKYETAGLDQVLTVTSYFALRVPLTAGAELDWLWEFWVCLQRPVVASPSQAKNVAGFRNSNYSVGHDDTSQVVKMSYGYFAVWLKYVYKNEEKMLPSYDFLSLWASSHLL